MVAYGNMLLLLAVILATCVPAFAVPLDRVVLTASESPRNSAKSLDARRSSPQVVNSGTRAGEAGYVHFFVITGADGQPETQIGIETDDGRIAWSLLDYGVTVSPFVASGSVSVNGKSYAIEHLYAIRPFSEPRAMQAFQRALPKRLSAWLEAQVPYCVEDQPGDHGCVSCLGFVARVLYPGRVLGALPDMPADFRSARKNVYTTEDLLMYLARVPIEATRDARLRRIDALDPPSPLRDELVRLAQEIDEPAPSATPAKRRAASLPKRMLPRRRS